MTRKFKRVLTLLLSVSMAIICTVGAKAEETKTATLDLMLVVDDTVSMQRNDPNQIATVALQMFADKIPSEGSRIGMATYDDSIMTSQPMLEVNDAQDKETLKAFARSGLTQGGHYTDLPTALNYAVEQLQGLPEGDSPQAIIAVSDGENDFMTDADKIRSDACLETVLDANIPVYLIVINTGNAEKIADYMDGIAEKTGGSAYYVKSGDEVSGILDEITNGLYRYEVDTENHFDGEVDKTPTRWDFGLEDGVFEANLELTHEEELMMTLQGPDGQTLSMTEENGIVVFSLQDNDKIKTIIKMLEPAQGDYLLEMVSPDTPQHVIGDIVLNKEIYVNFEISNSELAPGEEFSVSASLMRGSEAYTDLAFNNLNAKVLLDGQTVDMNNNAKGFSCNLTAPDVEGEYTLQVTVKGKTFNRSSDSTVIQVKQPGAVISSTPAPDSEIEDQKTGFPWWVLLPVIGIVIVLIVFLMLRRQKSGRSDRYIPLQGTLTVTFYQQRHIFTWEKYLQPSGYYNKRNPQVSVGKMLRDLQDGEIPAAFDKLTVAGVMKGNRMYWELKSLPNAAEISEPVDLCIEINTGMQEDDFDSFEDEATVVVRFSDGSQANFAFALI